MKQLSFTVFHNKQKPFSIGHQPGRQILEAVNEQMENPKREGIPFICKKGACRSCIIHVEDGETLLTPPSRLEQRALQVGKTTIASGYRLACMTHFKDS